MKKVLLLVKNDKIQDAIEKIPGFPVVMRIDNKDDLFGAVNTTMPDIIFATEGVYGSSPMSLVEMLCTIKQQLQNIKIIYLLGNDVDVEDEMQIHTLSLLIQNGIYNLYLKRRLQKDIIEKLLNTDCVFNDVKYILEYLNQPRKLPKTPVYDETSYRGNISEGKSNIIAVSSIKPGTGKSFVSTNIAADIARFGNPKPDGTLPSVVIIEGDLQTLSVGTLLGIENSIYNLREALNRAAQIIRPDGVMIGSYEEQLSFKEFIKKCCLPYRNQKNLFALVGSQLSYSDIENINPYQYSYMVEVISSIFDVVVIDANSSLEHRTTGPILQLAKQCFYVLDLDYNNIRTNLRYRQELSNLGVLNKIKYVLNKAITKDAESRFSEKLDFDAEDLKANDFEVVGQIPMMDNALILNRMYDKIPIVYDTSFASLMARMEFCKLADMVWKMSNGFDLKMELRELKESLEDKGKKNKKKR